MARYSHRLLADFKTLLKDPRSGLRLFYDMRIRAGRYILLRETFIAQPYYWLKTELRSGTTLIDIGANIGDTAIYFAMDDKVRRVVAYELMPHTFNEARQNVGISPYKGKISLINKAVSDAPGSMKIDSEMLGSSASSVSQMARSATGVSVERVKLGDVLKGMRNVAIKCDCEGDERSIFNEADLSNVYAIQVEYHNCLPEVLKALRSKGFKAKGSGTKAMGFIYATR
ncbi:MAG TPA: FkbM family methyltransferase [Candidatus Baltobacteraceae bacterium]|nr:FkbM family methyltransferase [Candidatus Baltobacteraceae bacterium]